MPKSAHTTAKQQTGGRAVRLADMRGHGRSSARSERAKAFARAAMAETGRRLPDAD